LHNIQLQYMNIAAKLTITKQKLRIYV
jgi:hypothetical protein